MSHAIPWLGACLRRLTHRRLPHRRPTLRRLRGRPLPLAIAAMGLLFALKLTGLVQWQDAPVVLTTAGRVMMRPAQAAGSEAPQPEKPPGASAQAPAASPHANRAQERKAGDDKPIPPATPNPPADPAPSDAERALLTDLRARRQALDQRAQTLDARDALAAAAEKRLQDRVDQLAALQTRLEALDQTRRDRDEANWRSLVKTYETMKPKDAATIFNDLDQSVLLQVLDRMKESKAAPVLAGMQPERARLITAELARWRNRAPAGRP